MDKNVHLREDPQKTFFFSEGVAYIFNEDFLVKEDETIDEDIPLTLKNTKKLHTR